MWLWPKFMSVLEPRLLESVILLFVQLCFRRIRNLNLNLLYSHRESLSYHGTSTKMQYLPGYLGEKKPRNYIFLNGSV